ncbi:TonB-dependent receptor [Deminuibacter soli]|uniref:TonB-dependent receptor n=2 Tax=Deminuibacter soli TaxID=2291815 RepID=A0A3E1NCI0_9BACT|nr:TonB-dependent receptor [Deminuibacter soli]
MHCKLLTLLLCSVLLAFTAGAQTVKEAVRGVVKNEKNQPMGQVSVIVKDKNGLFSKATQTNDAGMFSFRQLENGHTYNFTFSYLGYQSKTMDGYLYNEGDMITLAVKMDSAQTSSLNEVVVVGYGTQRRANVTGAVTQVGGEVLDNRSIPNITQGLQGVVPNLNLVMGDGKPIQSPAYNVRGTTSIGQGGNALVLIDGVEGNPTLINPNDVASITVLKDASSAAIYGARAAFGVVLITTKTPAKQKTTISYSSNYSFKKPTTVPDVVTNGYQYASMFNEAWSAWNDYSQTPQNINKTQPFSPTYLAELKRRDADPSLPKVEVGANGNYVYYGNTDWYHLLYKDHTFSTDQNLSVSGSSDKAGYYITGRYFGQDGIFRYNSDDFKMYNFRAKGFINLTSWLQINNNTDFSYRSYHNPLNVGEGGSIWRNMADEGHPSSMLYNPDGTFTQSAAYTVGDFVYGKNGIDTTNQLIRNTTGFTAKFMHDHLRIKGDFTFQKSNNTEKQRRVQVPYSVTPGVIAYVGTGTNDLQQRSAQTQYLASNIYAEYETRFGADHYFKALAGYNYEQSTFQTFLAARNGIVYSDANNINLALGQNINTSGGYEKWAILGGFSRLNYAYKDRYLVEVDGRYDGSSKFPADQRYAFFPSVSAGWRVSKEAFWHVPASVITDVKIRGSYGSLGNGNVASYTYQEKFGITQLGRVINGVLPQQTSQPNVLPDGLTWETATTKDLGLDLVLLSNRFTITGDVYKRNTTNMFTVGQTLPAVFGTDVPKGNYADLKTTGWELSLAWKDLFMLGGKPFHYGISAWMSDYQSTITKYNNATNSLTGVNDGTNYYAGQKVGEIWGYTNDGYWTADNVAGAKAAQALFKASTSGQYLPGDIKLKDLNKDGVINNGDNTVSKPGDLRVIGNSTPRYSYGFNLSGDWNNFFIGAFFQGVGKQDWWPGGEADVFWGQYNRPYNYAMKSQLGKIWSESNPDAYFPRYRGYIAQGGNILNQQQSKYLQNVRYIRLKNIQIGYNLPQSLLAKAHITGARVYVSGENLWSHSPLYKITKDLDVENIGKSDVLLTGNSNNGNGNNYPILKSVTVGLSINL